MSQKNLQFDSYADAYESIVRLVKSRKVDLSVRHILLVPEKDTLKCEQMLFSGGGAMDAEVYSLSRWFFFLGGGTVLPPVGAVMILKDILYGMELKCFFRSKNFDGFCARLYDTICALEDGCVDIAQLSADGALGLKLYDLKQIYDEFKRRTKGMYIDRVGKVQLLTETLPTHDFLRSAHIYAAGFGCLTKAERQLFEVIGQNALSFTVAEVSGRPKITADVEIYKASSVINSLKAAAGRIRALCKNGAVMDNICVVAPPSAFQQAKRIFGEYEIPFYVDSPQPLPSSRLSEYLRLLLELKRLGRREFILLSKNPLSGVNRNDSDVFEDYCNAFLVDYLGFSRPFTLTDGTKDAAKEAERLQIAEKVRGRLYKKAALLWDGLDGVRDTRGFSAVMRTALESVCAENQPDTDLGAGAGVGAAAGQSESGLTAEKEKILGVLAALDRFLGGGAFDKKRLQFLISAFLEGISSEVLEKLPRTQGCVLVGDAGIFKGRRFDYTFVIGFAEGVLPAAAGGKGLITRQESEILAKIGAELPTEAQMREQSEYELLQLFAASKNLFLSYVHGSEQRPSPLLYEVVKEARQVREGGAELDRLLLSDGTNQEMAWLAGSKSAGLELLALERNNPTRLISSLYQVLKSEADKLLFFVKDEKPQKDSLPAGIFLQGKTVSASQLQSYFACPYKHFAEYGLRAAKKKTGKADSLDIGTAVHKVNQLYSACGFDQSKLGGIIDEVLSGGAFGLKQNQRLAQRLKKEIEAVCSAFGSLITRGKFARLGEEIRFGRGEKYEGYLLGDCMLKGSVDYADAYGGYVRIIDYKTGAGSASLSQKDLYFGRRLQLPLYMLTMRQNGFVPAAMLYFVFKSSWAEQGGYFSGVYLADKEILTAFDPDMQDENAVVPAKIKITKSGEKITGKGSVDAQKMDAYLSYAGQVSELAVRQIAGGNITPSPLKDGSFCACDWCGFLPACGFAGQPRLAAAATISGEEDEGDE